MDDIFITIKKRHSCRNFINQEIKKDEHYLIMWAGYKAPFASGGPRREILCTKNQLMKNRLSMACFGQPYVADCSHVYVICGKDFHKEAVLKSGFSKFVHDCDMAVCQMHLMATALNLGSCIIGHFKIDQVKDIMGTKLRPTIILIVGVKK